MFITSILLFVEDVAENVTERVAKKLTERAQSYRAFVSSQPSDFVVAILSFFLLRRCVVFLLIRELSRFEFSCSWIAFLKFHRRFFANL